MKVYSERFPIKYLFSNYGICLGVDTKKASYLFLTYNFVNPQYLLWIIPLLLVMGREEYALVIFAVGAVFAMNNILQDSVKPYFWKQHRPKIQT